VPYGPRSRHASRVALGHGYTLSVTFRHALEMLEGPIV
jgi:hypothetical protein